MSSKEASVPHVKQSLPTGEGCFHDAIVFKIGTGGNAIRLSSVFNESNLYKQFLTPDQYFIVAKFEGDLKNQKAAMSLFSCAATASGFPSSGTTNIYFSNGIIAMAVTTAKSISHNREYPSTSQKGPVFSMVRLKNNSRSPLKNEHLFSQLKNKDLFNSLKPVDPIFFDSEEWNSIKVQLLKSAKMSDLIEEKKPYSLIPQKNIIPTNNSSIIKKEIEEVENRLNELKKRLQLEKKKLIEEKVDSSKKNVLTFKDIVVSKSNEISRCDSRSSEKAWSDFEDDN